MTTSSTRRPLGVVRQDNAVSPLELFFDLVFVFALTQVTATMADNLTTEGLLRGVLVVSLLWWSWTGYAWLGNLVQADEGVLRMCMLVAMAGMFILALCIPEAFDDAPGGVSGPLTVAVAYLVVRVIHLVLFYLISAGDRRLRGQLLRFTPSLAVAGGLLLAAAAVEGDARMWLWAAALLADYLGTWLGGASGWRIRSPKHFAERHGLITIVALGESIVAIGVGVAQLPISWPIIAASVLGLSAASALWWLYFDVTALTAERAFSEAPEEERAAIGRDAYTFIHLPMIAGVVLLALGLKKVLEYVGDTEHHDLSDPLKGVGLAALTVGAAMFLLAQAAFKWRVLHHPMLARIVVAIALLAVTPFADAFPALVSLAVVTAAVVAVVVYESVHYAEARREARHDAHAHTD